MEASEISEIKRTEASDGAYELKDSGKCCIYYQEAACKLPGLRFKICNACPRASRSIKTNPVESVFSRIRALAVMFISNMGIGQGGVGGGAAGSGGAGRGGG